MPPLFVSSDSVLQRRARALAGGLPELRGDPIRLRRIPGLHDHHGPVHGASFLRERSMAFDCTLAEFPRIFVHELFHFVWLRAGNPVRWSYERLLRGEFRARVRGELGWSAEWRKADLSTRDLRNRSRLWREYCCESFCDTAAWLHSGIDGHDEFTLPKKCRRVRRQWYERELAPKGLSI